MEAPFGNPGIGSPEQAFSIESNQGSQFFSGLVNALELRAVERPKAYKEIVANARDNAQFTAKGVQVEIQARLRERNKGISDTDLKQRVTEVQGATKHLIESYVKTYSIAPTEPMLLRLMHEAVIYTDGKLHDFAHKDLGKDSPDKLEKFHAGIQRDGVSSMVEKLKYMRNPGASQEKYEGFKKEVSQFVNTFLSATRGAVLTPST